MENKTDDVRIRRTKARIRKALMRLLQTTSINKISVTMLCKEAEINRSTFYCYYEDALDVLEELENERFETFFSKIRFSNPYSDSVDAYEAVFNNILQSIDTVKIIFSEKSGSTYYRSLYNRISPEIIKKYRDCYPEAEAMECTMLAQYIINGATSLVRQWVFDENRCPPRDAAEFLVLLFESTKTAMKTN